LLISVELIRLGAPAFDLKWSPTAQAQTVNKLVCLHSQSAIHNNLNPTNIRIDEAMLDAFATSFSAEHAAEAQLRFLTRQTK
jgi:hypothetical protein